MAGCSKRYFLGGGLILIAAVTVLIFFFVEKKTVEKKELVLYGNVDIRQVDVGFRVGGRIEKLHVEEGVRVKQGALLAELDSVSYRAAYEKAKGGVQKAEANLLKLKNGSRPEEIQRGEAVVAAARAAKVFRNLEYLRAEKLIQSDAVARKVFDDASAKQDEADAALNLAQANLRLLKLGPREEEILAGRAEVAVARASLESAKHDLEDTVLRAPSDAIVQTRIREVGSIVTPGSSVFTLSLVSPVWVRAYVNEKNLGRIRPGMPVGISNDSEPGKRYHGTIGFISPVAEFTPKSVETATLRTDLVYRLRIVVENPGDFLRQGMPVTIRIKLEN